MRTRDVVRITLAVAGTLIALTGLFMIRHILLLVGVAAFLAIAMEPAVAFIQKYVKSRKFSVTLMLTAVVAFFALFFASIVPPIASQVANLIDDLPKYQKQLQDDSTLLGSIERRFEVTKKLKRFASKVAGSLGTIAATFADALVIVALTIYILANLPKLKQQASTLVPTSKRRKTLDMTDLVFSKVGGWMEGNIFISIIAGVVTFIALRLIGVPFPAALAMWVAIADMIPMVGAMLGAAVCVAVAFFTGVGPGIATAIFFLVYQQIENYIISPRVMKRTVDVSALAVIIAALVGAKLLGVVGVLLAVPAAASIKVIAKELWLDKRKEASTA
ncbi:MAG: AI-2E family transporter [Actinomycetota bacterium]